MPEPTVISIQSEKLSGNEFYHLAFFPKEESKRSFDQLPAPFIINNESWQLVDLGRCKLFDLDPNLIKEATGKSQVIYITDLIEKYPGEINRDTEMIIYKFKR